ncbi:MAG: hypothetical protein GY805_21200 [Chloroflexi bacterium]|nr:hypothetical protein [Chloroflexota bacterium]
MPINRLIVIGFFCVLAGAVLPFVIVIGLVESTFFLNFLAFATSTIGIFLGVLGTATYVRDQRHKDKWHNHH